jgi:adenine-specific DNA-methyltransferase
MTDATNEQPESFDLNSDDVAARKRAELKRLFPEVFNEDKIDLDQLRRVMGDWVDEGSERFGLTWPGKAACMKVVQAPATGALRPDRAESVNFDDSENVFIEGDNLEVLKLLQKAYFGKIKMIYIDPPYNTGNEFIYPDKYAENLDTYLTYTGQASEDGKRFATNTESTGRFHSRWLNMMYPRLYLARNLLRDDGVIFLTIEDNEEANLSMICDQIFGAENFRAKVSWQKKYSVSNNFKGIASVRDYVLIYAKSDQFLNGLLPRTKESADRYQNPDNDPRGPWKPVDYWNIASVDQRPNCVYPIVNPNTAEVIVPTKKSWKFERSTHDEHVSENKIWWGKDGRNSVPALKLFLTEVKDGMIPHNWWPHEEAGHTDGAKKYVDKLFGGTSPFDTPKPLKLIERMAQIADLQDNDIVLDFFAGSCSTAEAVARKSDAEGINLKYIMVQLPEHCDENSEAKKQGYADIAAVGRERLRRAHAKIGKGTSGFRSFRLSESNFTSWSAVSDLEPSDLLDRIEQQASHLSTQADREDILYELLLKDGFELSTKFDLVQLAGAEVFSIADGALLICLERKLTKDIIDALADLAEEKDAARVVCLDAGFQGNDELKTNAVQTFKSRLGHGEDTSIFRTV